MTLPDTIDVRLLNDQTGEPVVRTVVLADEWPGDGLRTASVTSTAGDRLKVSLTPVGGNILVGGLDLKKRQELTISYAIPPGATSFDETITVTPEEPKARPATIRLRGEVVPDAEVQPGRLVLQSRSPGRIIEYRRNRPGIGDVRLIEAPPGVTVEPVGGAVGDVRLLRLGARMPDSPGVSESTVVLGVGDGPATIRLPLKLVVLAD
jgi:hypothetical protein